MRWLLVLSALIFAFCFLRLYQLHDSLLFFIDIGRDNNVLLDWYETGKPPLLGPQTSALPINQSAVYFYLLFPMAVATGFSPFSTIYTTLVLYLTVWLGLLWWCRRQPVLIKTLTVVWLLLTIHPEFIIQNRFVWNPSFVGPMMLIAWVGFVQLRNSWTWQRVAVFSVGAAAAVSFNYSAVPAVIAFLMWGGWYFRRRVIWLVLGVMMAGFVLNVTTLIFEVRHNFPLTQMALYQKKLAQTETSLQLKTRDILRFTVASPSEGQNQLIALGLLGVVGAGWWVYQRQVSHHTTLSTTAQPVTNSQPSPDLVSAPELFVMTAGLVVTTYWLLLLVPVSILSHYIFGLLTLWLLLLALLPRPLLLAVLISLTGLWLRPSQLDRYFSPARRTVAQMERCFEQVCQDHHQPLFVSVQAGFHPFHAAQEDRFLLRKAGCTVPLLDTQPQGAEYMAVVVDDSVYEHGKTSYNELTQFGPSDQVKVYQCQANFQVHLLHR